MRTAQAAACWVEDPLGAATGFVEDLVGMATGFVEGMVGVVTGWVEDPVAVATGWVEDLLGVLDDHFAVNCSLVEGNLRWRSPPAGYGKGQGQLPQRPRKTGGLQCTNHWLCHPGLWRWSRTEWQRQWSCRWGKRPCWTGKIKTKALQMSFPAIEKHAPHCLKRQVILDKLKLSVEKRREVTHWKGLLGTQCGGVRTPEFSPVYIKQRHGRKFRAQRIYRKSDMTWPTWATNYSSKPFQTWLIWEDPPTKRSFGPAVAIHSPETVQKKNAKTNFTKQLRYLLNPPSTILEWQNITWGPLCGAECKKIPQWSPWIAESTFMTSVYSWRATVHFMKRWSGPKRAKTCHLVSKKSQSISDPPVSKGCHYFIGPRQQYQASWEFWRVSSRSGTKNRKKCSPNGGLPP